MAGEGNCWCCGDALAAKHRTTIHRVLKIDDNGPVRGLEEDVNLCGDCVQDADPAMTKFKGGPEDKPAPVPAEVKSLLSRVSALEAAQKPAK